MKSTQHFLWMKNAHDGIQEAIENHGLFCTLYTDRGSHYWTTPKTGERVNKNTLTQFGRAMQQLGIEMIPAYSPQARGRSERMFGTLQGRLPQELKLAKITRKDEANRFIREIFLATFNARFKVPVDELTTCFVPCMDKQTRLREILCLHEERTVNKDNTVSYKGMTLQINRNQNRYSYARVKVKVHEYREGELAIYYGPNCLGRYDSLCHPKQEAEEVKMAA